jgi:hypothetical protein
MDCVAMFVGLAAFQLHLLAAYRAGSKAGGSETELPCGNPLNELDWNLFERRFDNVHFAPPHHSP